MKLDLNGAHSGILSVHLSVRLSVCPSVHLSVGNVVLYLTGVLASFDPFNLSSVAGANVFASLNLLK